MKVIHGQLKRAPLGPGAWVLATDDGQQWHLVGDVPPEHEGRRVRAEGTPEEGVMGFAMAGPVLRVHRLQPA